MAENDGKKPTLIPTPEEVMKTPASATSYADLFDRAVAENFIAADRNTAGDTAVGLVDTTANILSIPLAAVPGRSLADGTKVSEKLDAFRSPAYLQERQQFHERVADVTAAEGELAGFLEAVQGTLQGGNLVADATAQAPYLAIGPAARGIGLAAEAALPAVLRTGAIGALTGTGNTAIVNRVAALSGILEGAGGYAQTYDRAIAEGYSPEEAKSQATLAGLASLAAGTVLGKLTPGFELDPLGRRTNIAGTFLEDILRPHVSAVAGEVTEEVGIAITNTIVDNVLAGKHPMEGIGGQMGQAAALAGAFSGALRTPGAIRDTSKAIGTEVARGLRSAGSALAARAETPEGAATAVAAAQAEATRQATDATQATTQEEVIQSTAADTVTATPDAGSSSEPATRSVAKQIEDSLPENQTQQVSPEPTPDLSPEEDAEQLELVPPPTAPDVAPSATPEQLAFDLTQPLPTTNSGSPAVDTVLTMTALTRQIDGLPDDGSITEEQAKAIENAKSYEEVSNIDRATRLIGGISDLAIDAHMNTARAGSVRSQQVLAAVAATDLTKVPEEALPEKQRPLRRAMLEVKAEEAENGLDKVTQQILETGFDQGKKTSAKRKGINEYAQAVRNAINEVGEVTQSNMARRMAVFMKQLQNRAFLFQRALERVDNPTAEEKQQGYIDVIGTETLDSDGNLTDKPFRIWLHSDKSKAAAARPYQDVLKARKIYDALKAAYPAMFEEAEAYADKELQRMAARKERVRVAQDRAAAREGKPSAPASATPTPSPRQTQASNTLINGILTVLNKVDSMERLQAVADRIAKRITELSPGQQKAVRDAYRTKRSELLKAEAEAKAAAEAKAKAEAAEKAKKEAEKAKKEAEAKAKAEAEARAKAEAEAKAAEEARKKAEEEAAAKAAPSINDRVKQHLDLLRDMIKEVRWDEVGGRIIRASEDYKSEVVGRTKWLHSLEWWDRSLGLSMAKTREMLERVVANPDKRLGSAQTRVMTALLDWIDENLQAPPQESQEEASLTPEEQAEQDAEDEARRKEYELSEERVNQEDADQQSDEPDVTADTPTTDVAQETPDGPVRNPLLTSAINWVSEKFQQAFHIKPEVSLENWLNQINPADREQILEHRAEILEQFKGWPADEQRKAFSGLMKKGMFELLSDKRAGRLDQLIKQPFGVASLFWAREVDADGKTRTVVPDAILEAYATAAVLQMYRVGSRYTNPIREDNEQIRRDAIPEVWAAEIARDAMLLLGLRGSRKESLTYVQGTPLSYGLMAVQALVNTGNFQVQQDENGDTIEDKNGFPEVIRVLNEDGHSVKVLVPTRRVHEAALASQALLDRVMDLIGGPRVYEVSLTPFEEVPDTIQRTRVKTSDKQKTAVSNLNRTPHRRNAQLHQLRHALGSSQVVQLLTGYYQTKVDEENLPTGVVNYLKSVRLGWFDELAAADYYDSLAGDNAEADFYFNYRISSNGRTASTWGPQSKKVIRDLFSSAYQQLNLDETVEHEGQSWTKRDLLEMALAQALGAEAGIKTDTMGPTEVLEKWRTEVEPGLRKKALKLQELLNSKDKDAPAKIMALLKEGRSTPYSPRELNGLLTLGRLLNHKEGLFDNYLAFEIDGKTNGAFNTEMFFGLATITPKNLEQGGLFLGKSGTTWQAERERVAQWDKDFYVRLGNVAQVKLREAIDSQLEKYPKLASDIEAQLLLLESTDLLELTGPLDFVFKRLSGKTAALPVQYGGRVSGVRNQLWSLMASNLVKKYLATQREIEAATKAGNDKAAARLTIQLKLLESNMEGMDSINKPMKKRNAMELRWYYATTMAADALLKAYKVEKPVVTEVTEQMILLTNLAFAGKSVQFYEEHKERLANSERNKELREEVGETNAQGRQLAQFALPQEEYYQILGNTHDLSFSTAVGQGIVSLNNADNQRSPFRVTGLGSSFEGHLNVPVPAEPGVRILALMTIAAGDAAMGTEFNQTLRYITDVFDGIEFRITDFMAGGTALNEAVWNTLQHDVLRDFFPLMEKVRQQFDKATPEQQKQLLDTYNEISKEDPIESFEELQEKLIVAVQEFQAAYEKQRAGLAKLHETGPHTMLQMGGGGSFTTPGPVREAAAEVNQIDPSELDDGLRTSFDVRKGQLNRSQVIEALDAVRWPHPIQRAVWKRIRALLPANTMVYLADTAEKWAVTSEVLDINRKFGSVRGVVRGQSVMLQGATPAVMLHELIHVVFTSYISNYITNINSVPSELRSPINDLIQLLGRFKKLPSKGRVGFVQNVIARLEFMGDTAAALDEMLTFTLSEQAVIEELSPGLFTRITNVVKQILSKIFKINVPPSFMDEVLDVFSRMADAVPVDDRYVPPMNPPLVRSYDLPTLEQLTQDAYDHLAQRMGREQPISSTVSNMKTNRAEIETQYSLSPDQQLMFDRVFLLLRMGQRSADLEEFVSTTLPQHPNQGLFTGSEDLTASVLALAAVEPTFRAQLEATWVASRGSTTLVEGLIDKSLNQAQFTSVEDMLNEAFLAMMIDREYNSSFLGTTVARLDRLGKDMLTRVGEAATERAETARPELAVGLRAISALTSEKGAKAFGGAIMTWANELPNQRWLQDLIAAVQGTQGDGRLIYRAHAAMMSAISGTRAMFTTTLPKQLKTLFPADFSGWNTLHNSWGRLDVGVLGSEAREMYLNDAERRRMITVLQSQVENYVDAQNLAYYMVHQRIKPGQVQALLKNARAIADNLNNDRRGATEAQVAQVDQLVTLYAIEYLDASERAKVAQMYRDYPEAMDNLVGMLQKVKESQMADRKDSHQYMYWKNSLLEEQDPRSSVVVADPIKGAALERLGYRKGERYAQTAGDPRNDLHYYTRQYAPTPTFTQGIINTAQQTAMGINYTTATTISPVVGTTIADSRTIGYVKARQGRNSTLIPIHSQDGEIIGYERALDPTIINKYLKTGTTQLHLSIGKTLGRITEEHMARRFNHNAVDLIYQQWVEGAAAGRQGEYEQVNSTTDKQVARAWELVPKDMKAALEEVFPDGRVMIRRDLLANTLGYYKAGVLEIYTGDASMSDNARRAVLGLVQTIFMGPKGTQILLAAEAAVKEGVAFAKDLIIVRSLSVPYNNFMASINQVVANGVPIKVLAKRYQQGIREIRAYNRLQREVIGLTIKIAATHDLAEKKRLETIQMSKRRAIRQLSIWPLVEAGDLNDLPEGLEEAADHSYIGDLAGWVEKHVKNKIHPKAPRILANVLFAKDSELHDAMSKAIQAGDFLARYTIYMHRIESGESAEEARDLVRDELISYQTNPGRLRAGLEDYGLVWWSQFTLRAQNVLLRRLRNNPFSFFVAQGLANVSGTDGPLDQAIWERGWDNSTGLDQAINSPSAYIWAKVF